jgi:hypothetical protein
VAIFFPLHLEARINWACTVFTLATTDFNAPWQCRSTPPTAPFHAVQNEASHHHMCTPHRLESVRFILHCVVTGSKLIDLDIPVVFVTAMPQIKLTYISALSDHPNYTMDTLVSTKVVKSQSSSQAMSAYDRDPSIAFSTVLNVAWVPVFC